MKPSSFDQRSFLSSSKAFLSAFIVTVLLFSMLAILTSPRISDSQRLVIAPNNDARNRKVHLSFLEAVDSTVHCHTDELTTTTRLEMLNFGLECRKERVVTLGSHTGVSLEDFVSMLRHNKVDWASSEHCPRAVTYAESSDLPRTALLSFPGSGNTWARHIIEQLTGVYTGSIFNKGVMKHNFPGEGTTNGSVVVIKTHRAFWAVENASRYDRQVSLLRNPYQAMVAEYRRRTGAGHVSLVDIDPFNQDWIEYVEKMTHIWSNHIHQGILKAPVPTLVVFYEDMKTCLLPQLIKIAFFLRTSQLSTFSFCCALLENEGLYHRPERNDSMKTLFSRKQRKQINEMLVEMAHLVADYKESSLSRQLISYVLW